MKQIFTRSACLFWALLLTAAFSSETAVGQLMTPVRVTFDTNSAGYQLHKLPDAGTTNIYTNTALFDTRAGGVDGNAAYIEATPGVGNDNTNNRQYHGLIKLTGGITFRKGYTYKVTLQARGGSNNNKASSGKITLLTSPSSGFTDLTGTTSHGTDAIVTSTAYSTHEFKFNTSLFQTSSQVLYVGFRLHSSVDNKSWLLIDDIVITEEACPTNITVPTVNISTAPPACGSGQAVLSASGANATVGETYRWYASQADYNNGVHIPNQTAATFTTPSLDATATYYATIATAAGCESSPRAVTVTINQLPATPGSITGKSSVCVGTEGVVYSVPQVAGVTYNWLVPTGATIVGGANTNNITVNFSNTAQSGQVSVAAVSAQGCHSATRASMQVTLNPLPPASISANGPTSYCPATTATKTNLSVATAANNSYQWYKNGVEIPDATIFNYTPTETGAYSVKVTNGNGCSTTSNPVIIDIQKVLISNGSIDLDGQTTIEPGKPATYKVSSDMQTRGHALSYKWYMIRNGSETVVGGNSEILNIPSVPNEEFFLRCDITPIAGVCYDPTPLRIETTPINPLPVEIIYFTAAKQGNNVLLEWATASEENNTGFEVQVSQDGFNFRKLDFVPTKNGNTVIKQVYTFKDTENGKYGTRYYRLKQIDMDGQFEYFTTKAVSFGEVGNYSLKAFPNPFESEVSLELNADESGKLNVQVLDAMGRSVMTQQFEVSKGRSLEKITLWQSLPKGIYFVRTEMNGQANNFKLLKK